MISVIFSVVLLLLPSTEKRIYSENEHVTVELQYPATVALTKSMNLEFSFSPVEGIHVNTNPAFEMKLEKNSLFEVLGAPQLHKDKNAYLDADHPVVFSVKAKSGTATGKQVLKGKLFYFFCSDKDGWCNRYSQSFEITINVSR
ncbi:MAG: hypothetical protein WCW35_12835 [Bacteroidota bacterium]|jgi:hypothetical protein